MTCLVRLFRAWFAASLVLVCGTTFGEESAVAAAERAVRAAERQVADLARELGATEADTRSARKALERTEQRVEQFRTETPGLRDAREQLAQEQLRSVEAELVKADSALAELLADEPALQKAADVAEKELERARQTVKESLVALQAATVYRVQRDAMRALRKAQSEADAAQEVFLVAREPLALCTARVACQQRLIAALEEQTELLSTRVGQTAEEHRERLVAEAEALALGARKRRALEAELHATSVAARIENETERLSELYRRRMARHAEAVTGLAEAEKQVESSVEARLEAQAQARDALAKAEARKSALAVSQGAALEIVERTQAVLAEARSAEAARAAELAERERVAEAERQREREQERELARTEKRARSAVSQLAAAEESSRLERIDAARTMLAAIEEKAPDVVAAARRWHVERQREAAAARRDISLGVAYRHFSDIRFGGREFPNRGGDSLGTASSGPGDSVANRTAAQVNGPYGMQGIASPLGLPGITVLPTFEGASDVFNITIPLDSVTYHGSRSGVDARPEPGVVLSLGRTLAKGERWQFGVVGSMQYYAFDQSGSQGGSMFVSDGTFTSTQYMHTLVDVDTVPLDGVIIPVINPSLGPSIAPTPGTSTAFHVRNSWRMDLVVFDVGWRAGYNRGRLGMSLTLGPSLTIADIESTQRLSASWGDSDASFPNPPLAASPITLNAGTYTREYVDSSTDIAFGAYASLGLSYQLTPFVSAGLDVRYDAVGERLSTDQSRMDLDGHSLQLRLGYAF